MTCWTACGRPKFEMLFEYVWVAIPIYNDLLMSLADMCLWSNFHRYVGQHFPTHQMLLVDASCEILANISQAIFEVLPNFRELSPWRNRCENIRWPVESLTLGFLQLYKICESPMNTNYIHHIHSWFVVLNIVCKCRENFIAHMLGLTSTSSTNQPEGLSQRST